jgi:hypothetical protein
VTGPLSVIEGEAARAAGWAQRHLRQHPETVPAPQPGHTKESTMSVFTEAKSILHDAIAKIESVDEAAVAVTEQISVNPVGVAIVNEVAAIAHIPDPQGLLPGALAMLKAVSASLRAAEAATAAQAAPAAG